MKIGAKASFDTPFKKFRKDPKMNKRATLGNIARILRTLLATQIRLKCNWRLLSITKEGSRMEEILNFNPNNATQSL